MARRQTYTRTATVGPDGTAEIVFTAPNGTLSVQHTRVTVSAAPSQPTATTYINGQEFEGSYAGASDQSDSTFELRSQEEYACRWTGASPGATATMVIRGIQEDE